MYVCLVKKYCHLLTSVTEISWSLETLAYFLGNRSTPPQRHIAPHPNRIRPKFENYPSIGPGSMFRASLHDFSRIVNEYVISATTAPSSESPVAGRVSPSSLQGLASVH